MKKRSKHRRRPCVVVPSKRYSDLPNELIYEIGTHMRNTRTIVSFAQVDHRTSIAMQTFVHAAVKITLPDNSETDPVLELEKRYASQQVFKNYHNLLKKYGHHVKRITFIGLGVDNGHVLYCLSLAPQVDSVNLHCINTPATPFSGFDPEPACPLASSSKWTFNPDDLSVHLKKIHVDTCMVIVPEWNTFLNRLAPQLEELVIEDELTGIPIMDLFAISPLTQHVADTAALPAIWPRLRTLRLLSSHVYINTYSLTKIPPHSICGLRSLERFEIYLTRADSPIVLQQVLDASRHCLRELTVYAERKDRYLTVVSITEIRPCPAYGPYGPWCCPPTMAKCEVLESLHLTVTPRPDHRTATFLETIPAHMPTLKLDFIVPDSDAMYALKYILSVPVYLGHNPEHLDFDGRLAQALQRLKVDRLELSIRAPLEVSQGEMLLGTTILQFSRFPFPGYLWMHYDWEELQTFDGSTVLVGLKRTNTFQKAPTRRVRVSTPNVGFLYI